MDFDGQLHAKLRPSRHGPTVAQSWSRPTVPARGARSNETFLAKAPTVPVDMTFLDLEPWRHSIRRTPGTRSSPASRTSPGRQRHGPRQQRDTERTYGDFIEVVGYRGELVDEIMLPRCSRRRGPGA